MNKKIILLSIITILAQPFMHGALVPGGAGAITKLPPVKLPPGFNIPGAAAAPAISTPTIKLTPAQIETFASDISQVGGKQYLPQIQMVWETNPELIYNAQQAIQNNANIEARRQSAHQIMELAQKLASQRSETFNIQKAITHNPQLENLINQKLPDTFQAIRVEKINYQDIANESPATRTLFDELKNNISNLEMKLNNILTDPTLSPQQAANKTRSLDKDLSESIRLSETTSTGTKQNFRAGIESITTKLESIRDTVTEITNILQKTAPVQTKSATYSELKNFVESINAPTESPSSGTPSSLQPTTPGEIGNPIPMPTEIKPYFEAQKASMNTHVVKLAQTMRQLFKQDIPNLGLESHQQRIFDVEQVKISNDIKVFNNVLNRIKTLPDNPNAINEFKLAVEELSVIVPELTRSLAKLIAETKNLLPSEQKNILEGLQGMVREILAIYSDARTTLLVLEAAHANKEVMAQIKQNLDLGEFTVKTQKDLATVQKTARQLAAILSNNAGLLKTDKAPSSMLEVFESKLATYLTTFEELKTISKIEDLGGLQAKLKKQETELLTTLDSLFSKLAWLPTSNAKNEALDAFRKLKSEFLANKQSIDNIFTQAGSIQEKHTFVIIKKDELEMGMLTIVDKSKALRLSIKKTIPADRLTSEQAQALSNLDQAIAEELAALKKIQSSQTTLELDQLTQEFFKQKHVSDLSKKPSQMIVYAPKWEETLNETLKLFGLKLVLGLTTTGVVTWLAQQAEEATSWPTGRTGIPEIDNLNIPYLVEPNTNIGQTAQEFTQKSNQIVQDAKNLAQVPTADLDKVIHGLEMNMQILNFETFKKEAALFWNNFTAAIGNAISDAKLKFNQYRVTQLEQLKYWAEKNIQPLLETKMTKGTKLPKETEFKSEYQEVIALLEKYIKQ